MCVAPPARLAVDPALQARVCDAAAKRLALADASDVDLVLAFTVATDALADYLDVPTINGTPDSTVPVTPALEAALVVLTIEGYRQPDQPWSILQDPNFGATRLSRDQLASVRSMVASGKTRWGIG